MSKCSPLDLSCDGWLSFRRFHLAMALPKSLTNDNGNWKRKEFEHVFSIKHDNFWIAMLVFAGLTSQLTSKAESHKLRSAFPPTSATVPPAHELPSSRQRMVF